MFRRRARHDNAAAAGSGGDPYAAARDEMIENQLRRRGIVLASVLEAMRKIPRHLFVAHEFSSRAYADEALPSIVGQTISQPFIVAIMTQELQIQPGMRVLEIGTGTGYQTAVLAHLAAGGMPQMPEAPGLVCTIERVPQLSRSAQHQLAALQIRHVQFAIGDGSAGWPSDRWQGERSANGQPQFDRIIVTAGAPDVPQPLLHQLKSDGILILPIGPGASQMLVRIIRKQDAIERTDLLSCRFVPLLGVHAWQPPAPPLPPTENTA